MSTVQEIKSPIEQLPLEERAALIADLCGWSNDDWDRQMKADAAGGKFAATEFRERESALIFTHLMILS